MAVIDLTDDPRLELAMSSNIGQGIGAGINEYRRGKLESGIVGILQRGAVENWTPEQTREELLKMPNIINSQIGQELVQAQTGTGRFFRDPSIIEQRKASTAASRAREAYYISQRGGAKATRADQQKQWNFLKDQRALLVVRIEDELDETVHDSLNLQIKEIDVKMKELLDPQAEVAASEPSDVSGFFQSVGAESGNFSGAPNPRDIKSSFGAIGAGSGLVSPESAVSGISPKTPTSQTFTRTAINPKTGKRVGWDGSKWQPIR